MRRLFLAASTAVLFTVMGCSGNSSSDQPATATNANGTSSTASNASGNNMKSGATATKGGGMKNGGNGSANAAAPLVVPAGTVLTVRLGETLGSRTSTNGQGFSATLAEPLMIDG